MSVYKAMSDVSKELAIIGIAKSGRNADQNYNFRGIDSFLNTLSPILVKCGLVIVPRYDVPTITEAGKTAKGNPIFYASVRGEFDFISVIDGSKHTAACIGEGKDSGDKAISKAMSTAFKYMAAQSFCIPFLSMMDAESEDVESHADGSMDASKKADLMLMIKESATLENLKNSWVTATQAAQAADDASSFREFTAAKDSRKAELAK
jgi:ERF superfamily